MVFLLAGGLVFLLAGALEVVFFLAGDCEFVVPAYLDLEAESIKLCHKRIAVWSHIKH